MRMVGFLGFGVVGFEVGLRVDEFKGQLGKRFRRFKRVEFRSAQFLGGLIRKVCLAKPAMKREMFNEILGQ